MCNKHTSIPGNLVHVAYADDGEEHDVVEALLHVATRDLVQVVHVDLLEQVRLDLHKLEQNDYYTRSIATPPLCCFDHFTFVMISFIQKYIICVSGKH